VAPHNQILKQCSGNGLAEQQVWVGKQMSQQIMSRIIVHSHIHSATQTINEGCKVANWNISIIPDWKRS